MMKNRGITLVELIVSIALIGVVIIFLFRLLVDVRYSDNRIDYARNNQQTRAIILKTIQDDFLDYGLIGLNDSGSTDEKLIVNFTYGQSKKGKLEVGANYVIYTNASGDTEKWDLLQNNPDMKYNVRCVSYNKIYNSEGEFFSIWFRIPLIVKKNSENVIDDLEFSYIGKKSDIKNVTDLISGSYLGEEDTSECS